MGWEKLLVWVTGKVDEELRAKIEYLVAENRILREQIQGQPRFTDGDGGMPFSRHRFRAEARGRGIIATFPVFVRDEWRLSHAEVSSIIAPASALAQTWATGYISESVERRHEQMDKLSFKHGQFKYTVSIWAEPDPPNRFTLLVDQSRHDGQGPETLAQRTYRFSKFARKLSPAEQQPIVHDLLLFAEITLKRCGELVAALPEDWSDTLDRRI
jgi:hypothetical protein